MVKKGVDKSGVRWNITAGYDGNCEYGQIRGYWNDGTFFTIDLDYPETYGSVILYDGVILTNCVNKPESDISGDCKVNFFDLAKMSSEWLRDGTN